MTCSAILRGVLLAMASQTCAHVMSYGVFCHGRFGNVPVTSRTRYARLKMRCVAKFHIGLRGKVIYTQPRNFDVLLGVCNYFLNLRLFSSKFCVTQHAFSNRWNAGGGARISAGVAIEAAQAELHVGVVRKCNWLLLRETGSCT